MLCKGQHLVAGRRDLPFDQELDGGVGVGCVGVLKSWLELCAKRAWFCRLRLR